jgi:hypothetical protein
LKITKLPRGLHAKDIAVCPREKVLDNSSNEKSNFLYYSYDCKMNINAWLNEDDS